MCKSTKDCVWIFDRCSGTMQREPVLGETLLCLAYKLPVRPASRATLFKFSIFSRMLGRYADSSLSRSKIDAAIRNLGLKTEEFARPPEDFRSFNDFFTRRLKPECRPWDKNPHVLCSPADCRIACCRNLRSAARFAIKGTGFTLGRLLGKKGAAYAKRFAEGIAVVCRLSPADCHRYYFPADCRIQEEYSIDGRLDSVNPLALRLGFPIFEENRREITMLEYDQFGPGAYVEVGAFGVGRINHTHAGIHAEKMQEKGFFAFGGSTIVLIFEKDRVKLDGDLVANSDKGFETRVKMGERIGILSPNRPS